MISTQVTNVHRIGETIGDAWPLVAVDRVHRGRRHQRELKLRRQFSARSSDAVEAVDFCVEIKFRAPHAIDAMLSP